MTCLKAITPQTHLDKYWERFDSYKFARKDNLFPLVSAEIYKAIQAFPMAFVKQGENFILVGLTSLTPGQNMFVAPNGQWLGSYVPSAFRSYPFRLARAEGSEELLLCIDEDSGLISDTEGEPFLDEQRQLSKSVQDVMNFLSKIEQNRTLTQLAVSTLAEAGLITKRPLKIKAGEKEKPVSGLYIVDETKLNSLDDAEFLKLRNNGSIPVAYAQILSMVNISVFERLAKLHEQIGQQQQPEPDFGVNLEDDDTFHF